jgi:filamentous hemagglutinin family protein
MARLKYAERMTQATSVSIQPNAIISEFGQGYTQSIKRGFNAEKMTVDGSWTIENAKGREIVEQLRATEGAETVDFEELISGELYAWRVENVQVRSIGTHMEITATFVRMYRNVDFTGGTTTGPYWFNPTESDLILYTHTGEGFSQEAVHYQPKDQAGYATASKNTYMVKANPETLPSNLTGGVSGNLVINGTPVALTPADTIIEVAMKIVSAGVSASPNLMIFLGVTMDDQWMIDPNAAEDTLAWVMYLQLTSDVPVSFEGSDLTLLSSIGFDVPVVRRVPKQGTGTEGDFAIQPADTSIGIFQKILATDPSGNPMWMFGDWWQINTSSEVEFAKVGWRRSRATHNETSTSEWTATGTFSIGSPSASNNVSVSGADKAAVVKAVNDSSPSHIAAALTDYGSVVFINTMGTDLIMNNVSGTPLNEMFADQGTIKGITFSTGSGPPPSGRKGDVRLDSASSVLDVRQKRGADWIILPCKFYVDDAAADAAMPAKAVGDVYARLWTDPLRFVIRMWDGTEWADAEPTISTTEPA